MQVLNSSVARPWKLDRQASRQALRASRLWKLEQNSMTKKGPFFGPLRKKKQARKNGPPQFKIPAVAVTSQISFDLK